MTTFQLIMAILMIIGFVAVFGFSIAFIVEAAKAGKVFVKEEPKEEPEEAQPAEEENYDIRDMLAQLEEEAQPQEEPAEEEAPAPVVEVVQPEEVKEEPAEVAQVEEPVVEEAPVEDAPVEEPAEEETPKTIIIKEQSTILG